MRIIVILLILATSCSPINSYFGLSDDNFIEQMSEFAIREKTGLDIDLTPENLEH